MTTTLPTLFDMLSPRPVVPIDLANLSLDEQFERFHAANPHVYECLVALTRRVVDRGHKRVGMKMIVEVLRWEWYLSTEGDVYKLNNSLSSRYSRRIMEQEDDLAGVFETRGLRS